MSLMVKRLIALSLGQSLPQFTQTMVLTKPLLFLLRPWFLRFTGMCGKLYKNIFINLIFNIRSTASLTPLAPKMPSNLHFWFWLYLSFFANDYEKPM